MRKGLTGLALLLLFAAGCQKLNYSETVELGIAQTWSKGFTAPSYDQEVKVTVEPEACSVSAYLVTEANRKEVMDFLENAAPGKAPDSKLTLTAKTFKLDDAAQSFTIEAKVPARTEYWVILHGGKKTTKVA